MNNLTIYSCIAWVVLLLCGSSVALNCSQCNNRFGGVPNTCVSPKNMTDCMGCLKTVTKIKLRDSGYMDGWEKLSVLVSRVCMRHGSTMVKPAGCYKHQNNGGYTEQCFCYTDFCNSGATRPASSVLAWLSLAPPSSLVGLVTVCCVVLVNFAAELK